MKDGTQKMTSLCAARADANRFSGVGSMAGDFGSKALTTNPDEAYEID